MLANLPRARTVMEKHGLDGLIAVHRINVYYLTGFTTELMMIDRPFINFVVLPRREDMPAALTLSFNDLGALAAQTTWVPNIVAVTRNSSVDLTAPPEYYPLREGTTLTPMEHVWDAAAAGQAGKMQHTPTLALKKALEDAGLSRGRIGCDDPRIFTWLYDAGLTQITGSEASNVFREIRMIKTPEEIDLMRSAALMNEAAAKAAMASIREGAQREEIDRVFNTAWAGAGGKGLYILVGTHGGTRFGPGIAAGDPVMIDAIGSFRGYHGDIGRTVVVGEASEEVSRSYRAMVTGWHEARDRIRPGMRASELVATAVAATNMAGFPHCRRAVLHSLGLEHTDNPLPHGPDRGSGDLVLEENMVISFEMPHHETGWGHMHLEDSVLVTATGNEALTKLAMDLEVLPRGRAGF